MEAAAKAAAAAADTPRTNQTRCAIATTSCAAPGVDVLCWWATYHIKLGVDTIYLYVHDASVVEPKKKAQGVAAPSPLLLKVQERLKALNLERQVLALPALSHQKGAGTVDVVAMQERDVHDAIRRARSQGTDWLFHVDDDELLHLTSGKFGKAELAKVVEKARDSTFNLRLDNLEVRRTFPEIKEPYNFFEEETHFKLRVALHADGSSVKKHHDARFYIHGGNPASGADNTTAPFLSYWNGKSGGRLSEPGLKPCGVHFFGSARGDAACNGAQDAADGLVLLHYPFCHFATWRHKFNVLDATQRSDWGHYRAARLKIVEAMAPGGGGEKAIEEFYREAVMLKGASTSDVEHVAVNLPASARPQQWRTGVYKRIDDNGGRCYARCEKADKDGPKSYLWNIPSKKMWLVGSTPGATTGAAVAYDEAEDPSKIGAPWCVYDGSAWVKAAGAAVGAINVDGEGRRYAVVDAKRVFGDAPLPTGGEEEVKRRSQPDHARLAAIVLAALTHEPYAAVFWRACEKAAKREPPGAERKPEACKRALAAGARAVSAPRVAASLVAERMAALPEHKRRAARTLSKSRDAHADVLSKTTEDAVVLSIPGAESVQSWRAGVYARETQTLYKRVREADEQESFLYALPKRGMWLVGSTPGSTVGGLVAYDEVRDARKLNCAWHVFDGRTWAPARGVAVTVAKGRG